MSEASLQPEKQRGIAVIAVSGAPVDELAVQRGLQVLARQGFAVHSYYRPEQKFQRFGASDAERVAQIHAAASNPDVHVVMALRGSYGLSRLLPQIDFDLLAASGKCFVGYSDFTPIHLGLLARGKISMAGPMLCDDFTRENLCDYTLSQFAACLAGRQHAVEFDDGDNADIDARGILWGGNLAMLNHLLGTPYWTGVQDGILFLEDVGEHPYRVERMLLQLHYAGVLSKQKALVLGDFSAYKLAPHDNGYDFAAMLSYLRSILDIPVLTGLPFGHIRERASLVVGSQAYLQLRDGKARLSMHYAW
ncbi:MAG: LD-carboxypeptidase [Burkholderiales bacterium]|nr:LD-carboxypeptidase [Burkholderiales bacterium]